MTDFVQVDTTDLAKVVLELESNARHLDRLLPIVADILVSAVDDVYQAEGPGWKGFSPNTVRRRGNMGAAKLLQDTGVMAGSTLGVVGADFAEARTNVPYAKYHASGTARLPKRNPFELGPFEAGVLDEVAELCAREVTE